MSGPVEHFHRPVLCLPKPGPNLTGLFDSMGTRLSSRRRGRPVGMATPLANTRSGGLSTTGYDVCIRGLVEMSSFRARSYPRRSQPCQTTCASSSRSARKGKKVVATAWDWPGLERGGKTEEDAIQALEAYLPRYASVADRAGMGDEFRSQTAVTVVERYDGAGSTDFWGISFASSDLDRQSISEEEWERRLRLLRACWAEFDDIADRVFPELRKGPRGGGRDRDEIINHVFGNERVQFAKKVGVLTPQGVMLTPVGLQQHRDDYIDALREYHREGKMAGRTWTLSFLLRHTAYHVMDHAWEMEDKDLTGKEQEIS
jgi:hypothetical protein